MFFKNKIIKGLALCALTLTTAHAAFKDDVLKVIIPGGNPEEVMNNAIAITPDEAVVCLSKEEDGKIKRKHSNPRYNGVVTDENELLQFEAFFGKLKDVAESSYEVMSRGKLKTFKASKKHIDETHLCFVRTLDKSPPPAVANALEGVAPEALEETGSVKKRVRTEGA